MDSRPLWMRNVVACMGGWCQQRNACAHYVTENRANPAERLCGATEEPERITGSWRTPSPTPQSQEPSASAQPSSVC